MRRGIQASTAPWRRSAVSGPVVGLFARAATFQARLSSVQEYYQKSVTLVKE
jgi:hypothetical protein